ncbi:DNA-binding protein [Actinopolyspora erythraea]|uniref:DNA-binding protein n=1 Tax=Actinopolyspora erythraea TaxID=414996 RepID=A0A099D2X3_9ACTN|nr:excisionase family DNA-binding protein [Actinopolyspora erythraea]ASU80770.1 DNA-binding protein [Actinopolyspora erythraea]KGI80142.1 excisionase [Actinopolyspora erythraea]
MSQSMLDSVRPSESDRETAVAALPHVRHYLNTHEQSTVRLTVDDAGREALVVPRSAVRLFERILAHMAAGAGTSIVPTNEELTTQEAANLLNVSRPYLIGLLEAGEIDYRMVGTHRRVNVESLLEYMRGDDHDRRSAADELTRLSQDMDL